MHELCAFANFEGRRCTRPVGHENEHGVGTKPAKTRWERLRSAGVPRRAKSSRAMRPARAS